MKRYLYIAAAICLACVAGKMNAQEFVKGRIVAGQQSPVAGAKSVTGRVVDTGGQEVAFANILLYQDSDSTMISGCTSDMEGLFSLECADIEGKHLRVSFVGYETQIVRIGESPMTVVLSPAVMDVAAVTGYRKLYRQEHGEIVANVKGTILESLPKAKDVIAQLPFVSEQDGDFTVFGKGTPLIYINNRIVRDKEELERLMSSEIKSITVNTMPGARYDASVNAVIRIVTERPQGEGLGGSLYGGLKRSREWSTEEYASLNYRHGAWDVFGTAYWMQNRQMIDMGSVQKLSVGGESHDITYDVLERVRSNYLSTVAGVNYNPDAGHSAGVQYVYNTFRWKDSMSNEIGYMTGGSSEAIGQLSDFYKPSDSHNVNAYYSGTWGDRFALDLNADWMTGDATDLMNSVFADGYADDVNTVGTRRYDLYSARGVFSYTDGRRLSVDAGTEYSYTDVTQTYSIDDESTGIGNSDDVTMQNRWALFISAKAMFGRWGVSAGLRYEDIDLDYYNDGEYNGEQSRSYGKLFPNIRADYSGRDFQAVLGYERKVQYPTYSQLRSNVQYSSPFVYESGNPLLRPQIQNDFTGMLSYRNLKVMSGYTVYEDYITQLMSLYDGRPVVLLSTGNVRDARRGFLSMSYAPTVGIWRPNLELGGQWQYLDLNDGQYYDRPVFRTRWNNSFSLPGDWTIKLDGRWQSEGNSGIYLMESFWRVDAGVTKELFDGRLTVSLLADDIFMSANSRWHVSNDFMTFDYGKYSDTRHVKITVRYNFNTTRSKYKGRASSDEMRRL